MNKANWVQTWGQTHIPLSLFYYPEAKKTFRLVVNSAIGGEKIRITLSSLNSKKDVIIEKVTVALCDENGNITGEITDCKYKNSPSFTIKKAEFITLDESDFSLTPGEYFCISAYVVKGDLCSGNLMDNALLITALGDKTHNEICENERRKRDDVMSFAEKVLGFPIHKPIPLFETVEVLNTSGASAVTVFGDSLSQQGFWTNEFEKRLRKEYPGKYSLINRSAMGNRVLFDCSPMFILPGLYGKRATERVKNDVLRFDNISHAIMFIGINDIIQYGNLNGFPWEKPDIGELLGETANISKAMQDKGIKVMGLDVIPFGKCPDSTKTKKKLRRELNSLYKEHAHIFDSLLCVSENIADKTDPDYADSRYIGKDNLHINQQGGELIANLINMEFFK